ncbi:putative exocyst complex component Sec15 [Aspergillus saccharolyticus JOP 1030-1]|uniref:GPI ethanolamine phosphate transferase 2 n=1 Tax=Aspergillus saccharolyticus JOP 1030-1 TaxID=1450539 RepID=A0A318ZW36_9EURO|nr:putative exocyst complex component Sec15 [Aspergillus saccharolyticus JOP 1030-1]PYH48300.1 putative exocyst complex component Sec15 [Aspergillus saccharolyticus JOP 1030-1]
MYMSEWIPKASCSFHILPRPQCGWLSETGVRMATVSGLSAILIANILIPIAVTFFSSGFFPYKPLTSGLARSEDVESQFEAPFDKVIFMVVDALRSDFVYSNVSGFSFTQSLIRSGAALPFTAHASSPTVTMPRLKAMTTGSTPSFLDVIFNIAESDMSSTLALQDTWLAQLRARGGRLVMYGDDTWLKLFPGMFDRADGTTSFYVSDFTEVDHNVTRHVSMELTQKDWSAFIMHFLGLDHIGHKLGPRSPHMLTKQREMDSVVGELYASIEREEHLQSTLLVLCGDHGMNEAGNHGGSSSGETSPALLLISPLFKSMGGPSREAPVDIPDDFQCYRTVDQTDIIPTLAGLLGFPIPLNSLGVFIPDVLDMWHLLMGINHNSNSIEDHAKLELALNHFLPLAQKLLISAASNYNFPHLLIGISIMALVVSLLLSDVCKLLSRSLHSGTFLAGLLICYGGMMFASSYVEEEHQFWNWAFTAWAFFLHSVKEYSVGNRTPQLLQSLAKFASDKETEIEAICNTNHQEFVASVNQLLRIREGTVSLTAEILDLNQAIQASTERLAEQKRALVESRGHRQNIDETSRAIQGCLEVLRLANQIHDLLSRKNHYAALRALEEIQNVHLKGVIQYKIAEMIQRSVPATRKIIAEAVMSDLNTWLYRIREMSQYLGEIALYHTDLRKSRQKERAEILPYLGQFKLNSAIELVSDESEEYDLLQNDELQVDFTPLLECLHIHRSLGRIDTFRLEYANTRRHQKELLLPTSVTLIDEDGACLHNLLEEMAGFAIVERSTMIRIPDLRSPVDVDELWDSMCQGAVNLIQRALREVDNAESLLKIKNLIALFMQTMNTWGFPVGVFDTFLLTLFRKYADLLKKRFSDDFQEIVSTDDYMPMPIQTFEEYEKVLNVSWYNPETPREEQVFPCVLPFSQMYPLCCIDIRNFLNQFYFFANDDFPHANVIDETLKEALDELLSNKVCDTLVERLSSQYLGQIVQILINLEHFEHACRELELLLAAARSQNSSGEIVMLHATEKFRNNKKAAEKRIFEVVNSKIDDLIETAEYDWMASIPPTEPSNYMQTLTRFLSNIMNSTLLGLPTEIKELIYFDALSHAANMILALPLSPEVKKINTHGVLALTKDVEYLYQFVDSLGVPILRENLDELQQTVQLMQADNTDEFYDISTRNKKYGRVDAINGPVLLEKIARNVQSPTKIDKFATLSSRFGKKS